MSSFKLVFSGVAAFALSVLVSRVAIAAPSEASVKSCAAILSEAAQTKLVDLTVTISGLRNSKGHVLVSVYGDRCGGFPDQAALAVFKTQIPSVDGAKFVVEVPPGKYAIAVLHDANDNKKMDTFAGVPTEGFGFSNNAMKPFGPPAFNQATVVVPAQGASASITIKYML